MFVRKLQWCEAAFLADFTNFVAIFKQEGKCCESTQVGATEKIVIYDNSFSSSVSRNEDIRHNLLKSINFSVPNCECDLGTVIQFEVRLSLSQRIKAPLRISTYSNFRYYCSIHSEI